MPDKIEAAAVTVEPVAPKRPCHSIPPHLLLAHAPHLYPELLKQVQELACAQTKAKAWFDPREDFCGMPAADVARLADQLYPDGMPVLHPNAKKFLDLRKTAGAKMSKLALLTKILKTAATMPANPAPLSDAPIAAEPKVNAPTKAPAAAKPPVTVPAGMKMAAVLGSLLQSAKKPLMIAGSPPIMRQPPAPGVPRESVMNQPGLNAWKATRPAAGDLPAHAVGGVPEPSLFTQKLEAWKASKANAGASTAARPAVTPPAPAAPEGTGIGAPANPMPKAPMPVQPPAQPAMTASPKTAAVAPALHVGVPPVHVEPAVARPVAAVKPAALAPHPALAAGLGAATAGTGALVGSALTQANQPGLGTQLLDKGKELGGEVVDKAKALYNSPFAESVKNFAGGFAQNPMNWDAAHLGTAGGALAIPLLAHLLGSHKKKHEDDEA